MNENIVKKEIDNYFNELWSVLDKAYPNFKCYLNHTTKVSDFDETSIDNLIKIQNLVEEINKIEELVDYYYYLLLPNETEKDMLNLEINRKQYLDKKNNQPYIPVEVIEDGSAFIGECKFSSVSNLDIFMPVLNQPFTFSNGKDTYNFYKFEDVNKLGKLYKNLIVTDQSFYNPIPTTKNFIDHAYDFYKYLCLWSNEKSCYLWYIKYIKDMYNNLFRVKKVFSFTMGCVSNNILFIDKVHNLPLHTSIYSPLKSNLQNYLNFSTYKNQNKIQFSSCNAIRDIIKKIIATPDNDSIIIRLDNLKNIVNNEYKNSSNSYIKVTKTNPIHIIPINVNEEDYEWLQDFFKKYNNKQPHINKYRRNTELINPYSFRNYYYNLFFEVLLFSCQTIDDLVFTSLINLGGWEDTNGIFRDGKFMSTILEKPIIDEYCHTKWNEDFFEMLILLRYLSIYTYDSFLPVPDPYLCQYFREQIEKNDLKDFANLFEILYNLLLKYDDSKTIGNFDKNNKDQNNYELFYNIISFFQYRNNKEYIKDENTKKKILSYDVGVFSKEYSFFGNSDKYR